MEFKGTQGKWGLRENKQDIITKEKGLIITCYKGHTIYENIKKEEAEYNALLISKAPEMLEMLNRIVNHFSGLDKLYANDKRILENAKQLIKEATE